MRGMGIASRVHALIALLLMLAVVGSTGCAKQKEEGPALLSEEEILAEYATAAADLELPPGFEFPGMPLDGQEGVWQEGCGLVAAQMYWQRAWEIEWLEQRGKDPAREAAALDVLKNQVPEKDFMTKYADASTHGVWTEYVSQAEMGDPSGIQRDVDVNPMTVEREVVE